MQGQPGPFILNAGQWAQQFNRTACAHQTLENVCKLTGKGCEQWLKGEDCGLHLNHNKAVRRSSITPKLRALIDEADGKMLFVERGDPRFTREDLDEMANDVVLHNPNLGPYVAIDWSEDADAIITIYQGVNAILV